MSKFVDSSGSVYSWAGELEETTSVAVMRPGGQPEVVPFSRAVAMTNGAILEAIEDQPSDEES